MTISSQAYSSVSMNIRFAYKANHVFLANAGNVELLANMVIVLTWYVNSSWCISNSDVPRCISAWFTSVVIAAEFTSPRASITISCVPLADRIGWRTGKMEEYWGTSHLSTIKWTMSSGRSISYELAYSAKWNADRLNDSRNNSMQMMDN